MILGINHVGISVPDLEKALSFYCDMLGFKRNFGFEWKPGSELAEPLDTVTGVKDTAARAVSVSCGNLSLEIFHFTGGNPAPQNPNQPVVNHGLSHLCLAVKDLDYEYERLVTAGMEFHSAPVQLVPGIRTVYGRDPFGNVVELEEVKGRESPEQPPLTE